MTASDLVAFALLALFAGYQGLHQWIVIRRQHYQILHLQRLVAAEDASDAVERLLSSEVPNDQRLEQLGPPNQRDRPNGMHRPLPIS